uniref:beta strand repeat-containing protein n=1 Tax=Microbacterium sp. TaxID=51671 RepID=UPI003221FD7B
ATTAPAADPAPAPEPAAAPTTDAPAVWSISAAGDVIVRFDGGDVVAIVDGVETRRAAASVTGLVISAGGRVTLPAYAGVPITVTAAGSLAVGGSGLVWSTDGAGGGSVAGVAFSGVGELVADGTGVLAGPSADTTWRVTGAGSGVAGAQAFRGFSALIGAAGGDDTFIVSSSGSIDLVDGGAGGYDTLGFDGDQGAVTSRPTGPQSGTIVAGGRLIAYEGLEPVAPVDTTDFTFSDATDGDTIDVSPDAANPGYLLVKSLGDFFESHSVRPSVSFTILTTGIGAIIRISGLISFLGVDFRFEATRIVTAAGTVLEGGDITITATSTSTDATPADASIELVDTTLIGDTVSLTATAAHTSAPSATSGVATGTGEATASVVVGGTSRIVATGAVDLASSATVVLDTTSTGAATDADAALDAAVAHAVAQTIARTSITDQASVAAGGDLSLSAKTSTTVHTAADASAATAGAGIATTSATTRTSATIDTTSVLGIVAGGALSLLADSTHALTTTATASPGGATANGTSPSDTTATPERPEGYASTPDGTIGVAGALAFSNLDQETVAAIGSATPLAVSAGGTGATVDAISSGSASAAADGSAVGGSSAGVGVAVAVNLVRAVTSATIGSVAIAAGRVAASATAAPRMPGDTDEYRAAATSGAGGASLVGAAGALALNIASLVTRAAVDAGATIAGAATDVVLAARSESANVARALPGEQAGATTGIGATVAVNIVNDTAAAAVGDGAVLTGIRDLALTAHTVSPVTTEARGGVAAADVAIATVLALAIANVVTLARLGTGPALVLAGAYTGTVDQRSPVTTTAAGNADAESAAAVGIVLALTFADHVVRAELARDVTAAGSITLTATGAVSADTSATSSATGAPGDGDQPTPQAHTSGARAYGDGLAPASGAAPDGTGGTGPGDDPAPPSTPQGVVTVAAALALTVQHTDVAVAVSGVSLTAQAVAFDALGNVAATSTATGGPASRGPPSGTTIAAAVAITIADASIRAEVGPSTVITAESLRLTAGTAPQNASQAPDGTHRFSTTATGGAGSGGDLSVAGSVAVSVIVLRTVASLASGASAVLSGAAPDLTIGASSAAVTTTRALLADEGVGTPTTGIGAAFALASVDHDTIAELGAAVTGAGAVAITAQATDDTSAVAQGSARGADVAVAPFTAVPIARVTTTARTAAALAASGAL